MRSPRRLAVAAAVLATAMWVAPAAQAAPEDPGALSNSPTIGLVDMGTSAPLAFYGDQGTATLTFPVPQGLVPVTLTAIVELPVNVRSGTLTVTQDERTDRSGAHPAGRPGADRDSARRRRDRRQLGDRHAAHVSRPARGLLPRPDQSAAVDQRGGDVRRRGVATHHGGRLPAAGSAQAHHRDTAPNRRRWNPRRPCGWRPPPSRATAPRRRRSP